MRFPLDLVWINDGRVVDVTSRVPDRAAGHAGVGAADLLPVATGEPGARGERRLGRAQRRAARRPGAFGQRQLGLASSDAAPERHRLQLPPAARHHHRAARRGPGRRPHASRRAGRVGRAHGGRAASLTRSCAGSSAVRRARCCGRCWTSSTRSCGSCTRTPAAGCYVVDRRSGERDIIATAWSDPPSRHEIDDLFSVTVAAALESEVLVVCGGVPQDALPLEIYANLVADARAAGTKTIVDLSPPGPEQRARGRCRLRQAEQLAARPVHRGRRQASRSRSRRARGACSTPARAA